MCRKKRLFHYSIRERQRQERQCGGNNSPRAPLVPPRGFAARQDRGNGKIMPGAMGEGGSEVRKAFFQCAGKRGNVLSVVFQRSGAPGRFRAARPTAASRRNLLPPSSAAGVVQVLHTVQRVWIRRACAVLRRRKMKVRCPEGRERRDARYRKGKWHFRNFCAEGAKKSFSCDENNDIRWNSFLLTGFLGESIKRGDI